MNKLARALVSALLIVVLLIGVPIVLIAVAGWPLPTKMPNWDNVYWAIRQGDVPAEAVIKLFACVAWLAWAQIAWALLWELVVNVPRMVRGDPDREAPLTPEPASRLARRLITAAMVLTAISSTPATSAAAPSLSSFASGGSPPRLASPSTLVVGASDTARVQVAEAPSTWRCLSGDTLWDIAERCLGDGSEVDAILRVNPNLNPARPLRAGQIVQLPEGVTAPADRAGNPPAATSAVDTAPAETVAPPAGHRYTVVAGDTLWDIVERHYGFVTIELIEQVAADNGIVDPSLIYAGQVIVLRDLTPEVAAGSSPVDVTVSTYQVVRGDTLWDILDRHYGYVDADLVWAVARWNGLEDPSLIYAGQQLLLPPHDQLFPIEATPVSATPASADPATSESAPPAETPAAIPAPGQATPELAEPSTTSTPPITVEAAAPVAPATTSASSVPTSTSAPAVTSPSTPARAVEQAQTIESDDMLSSRWLFGGVAVTSLGLVGAWMTLKQKRRRRRRWLGLEPAAGAVVTAPTERERAAQADVEMLRELVDPGLVQAQARAVLLGEHPMIWFRETPPAPPAGWELADRGWQRLDVDEQITPPGVLSPALVTIGRGTDGAVTEVLLDLLSAGTVSVTGDRVAVERLVCSMLWELASDPLGGAVDLHIVGLACAAARHASNAGRSVSLDEAIAAAQAPRPAVAQVFLVDPFAGDTSGNVRGLLEACRPGSGRAVVIAGPCEHPVEQISVPSAHRVMWDDLTLAAPQLPETVDMELGRMLDATEVGRRDPAMAAMTVVPDPEAEAVALRSTLSAPGDWIDTGDEPAGDDPGGPARQWSPADPDDPGASATDLLSGIDPVGLPDVLLSVCGREVAVHGYPVPHAPAVLFVLAAAGQSVHTRELTELTGYAQKTLATVYTANHDLVERESGSLRLASHVWTDHAWATKCVTQLADVMKSDADSAETTQWAAASFDAIRALEQAPFAVLPTGRDRGGSAWRWVDDFPAAAPARATAETEVAEAALAFSELWLAAPGTHRVVPADQLVGELCRLASTVPFARVVRQLRASAWVTAAECLLSAAARVAGGDEALLGRVQQTARALAAREQLETSDELADELGL